MQKLLILSIFLLAALASQAQTDSSRVEQYCQLIATPRLLSNKVAITIDYGEERSIWQDSRLKTDAGTLKKFNTIIDAINYMGRNGWIFLNAFPVRMGETEVYHFAFKKIVSITALQ